MAIWSIIIIIIMTQFANNSNEPKGKLKFR